MATISTSLALQNNMSYNFIDTVYGNIGDTVAVTVIGASGYHWAEIQSHGIGGSPVYDDSGTVWTSSGITSGAHGSYDFAHFFSPYIHEDGTSATHSGRIKLSVPNPVMGSATHNNAISSSVTVTVSATAKHISTGTLQYSAGGSSWQTSNTFTQSRGTTVTYYARLSDSRWGNFNAVSATGSSTAASSTLAVPYIAYTPGTSLGSSSVNIGSTATTFQLSLATGTYNSYDISYLTTSSTSFNWSQVVARTQSGSSYGPGVFLNAPGGSVQQTNNISTGASEGSPATYYLWVQSWSGYGGDDVKHHAGVTGTKVVTVTKAGASFTVDFKDHGAAATNEYYDNRYNPNDTNNTTWGTEEVSIRHRVSLINCNSGYRYGISSSSSSYVQATVGNAVSHWKTPDSNGELQIMGAEATPPSVGDTDTFYIWRATDTSGSNAAYTNKSYTRKLVDKSAATLPYTNVNIAAGVTSINIVLTNTFQGHFYSLWDASSGGSIKTGTVYGNAGSTTITLSNGLPASGSTTFYLFAKTFASRLSGDVHQYTTNSFTVTRLSGDGSSTPSSPSAGTYGAEFRNASGNIILDSATSPIRRVLGSSSPVTVAAATNGGVTAGSTTVNVTTNLFASNASDYLIVLTPLGAVPGAQYSSSPYYAVKSTSSFAIKNTTNSSLNFDWEIFKKGSSQ